MEGVSLKRTILLACLIGLLFGLSKFLLSRYIFGESRSDALIDGSEEVVRHGFYLARRLSR